MPSWISQQQFHHERRTRNKKQGRGRVIKELCKRPSPAERKSLVGLHLTTAVIRCAVVGILRSVEYQMLMLKE